MYRRLQATAILIALALAGCAGSAPTGPRETRTLVAEWEGGTQPIVGAIDIQQGRPGGRVWLTHPNQEDICEGAYGYQGLNRGTWGIKCTNGDTAAGTMQTGGSGRGSVGIGVDSAGRKVQFRLGGTEPVRRTTPSSAPSSFDVGPSQGEAIPRTDIEAMARYCAARLTSGTVHQKREYCQCAARDIRASFSLQAFVTMMGEMEAEPRTANGLRRPHPDLLPLLRRCAAAVTPAATSR